jgi:hypothetical protein
MTRKCKESDKWTRKCKESDKWTRKCKEMIKRQGNVKHK